MKRAQHLPLPSRSLLRLRSVTASAVVLLALATHSAKADDEFTVVASIKPIHSIVSAVMEGVGEPHLIMKGTSSPHTFNLRPSDARALDRADVVFQVGAALEESLADIMWTLATRAEIVSLSHATKLKKLSHRGGGIFEPHDHAHEHGVFKSEDSDTLHSDSHKHDLDSHSGETLAQDGLLADSVDETFDMHIWLDPQNGIVIAEVVAAVLAKNDPQNRDTYIGNLEEFLVDMQELETELHTKLDSLNDRAFIAYHDAYRYFEDHFNLLAVGSAVVIPGRSAGARRILDLRQRINDLNVVCVFSEPQFDHQLIVNIVEGSGVKIGVLDPLGANLVDGKTLYPTLLRTLGDSFWNCLHPV